jgi:glucokinase
MTMTAENARAHITALLLERTCQDEARRKEALRDYLDVTQAAADRAAAEALAGLIPALMPALHAKWIGMFADRLLETLPLRQLELVCDGSAENAAALTLAYVMFLESARMERQIDEDMAALGAGAAAQGQDQALADMAASYIRARLGILAEKTKKQ